MNCFDETENDLRKERYVIRSKFQIINEDNELEAMPSAFGKINVSSKAYYQPVATNDAFGRTSFPPYLSPLLFLIYRTEKDKRWIKIRKG